MKHMNTKSQGLNMVVAILVLLVGFFVVTAVGKQLIETVPDTLQSQICEFNIRAAHNALDSSADTAAGRARKFFTDEAAKGSIKSPLCTTQIVDIDLTDAKNEEELLERTTRAIGQMTNTCWSQFGSGEVYNTFSVGYESGVPLVGGAIDLFKQRIWRNHYFSCYKFRLLFPKDLITHEIGTRDLLNYESGTLWRYTPSSKNPLDSSKTTDEYRELYKKNIGTAKAKNYLPYAGAIMWNNLGYMEFVEKAELTFGKESDGRDWSFNTEDYFMTIRPGSGDLLSELKSGVFYDVRYYSPIVNDKIIDSKTGIDFFVSSQIKNNIKVMPTGADSAGTEIIGIVT